jgi:RNA polymerase sigma-70 factor (ECF subfamily)
MGIFKKEISRYTDEELPGLIARGRKDAFSELYSRYSGRLLNYLCRLLNNDREKAEDFLHDLFLKIIERPGMFDPSYRFSTWIYTLATNMCRNEYRNKETRQRLLVENISFLEDILKGGEIIEEKLDRHAFRAGLQDALGQLDQTQREIIVLRFQEELSIKEIADILDCPEGTVKSRLFYTLKKLAVKLQMFNPSV